MRELTQNFGCNGLVEHIYLRSARSMPATAVTAARAEPGRGLIGDRRSLSVSVGEVAWKREVTLFQAEHLPTIGAWLGVPPIDAGRLRRNIIVSGINLISMRSLWKDISLQWRIGEEVVIEITGSCDPCSRMESELGHAGYNAMRSHGGVTARVLVGGTIRIADSVRLHVPSV